LRAVSRLTFCSDFSNFSVSSSNSVFIFLNLTSCSWNWMSVSLWFLISSLIYSARISLSLRSF
jgi:hypothetical protein